MALPLPKVVADVGPGGPIVTSMMGGNALTNSSLENQIKSVQAQYAPLTTQAEAASKLAYANLMGPQFLAKLMGNPDIVASMKDPQSAINILTNAATGGGTGASIFNKLQPPQDNSLFGLLKNKLQNAFGFNAQSSAPQNQLITTPNINANNAVMAPQQGSGVMMKDNGSVQPLNPFPNANPNMQFDQNGNPVLPSLNNNVESTGPIEYAKKAGTFAGTKEQKREEGKIRANAADELDQQYQQSLQTEMPLDHLIQMTQNPVFQNMRSQIPFFQDKQLYALSKIGTPEQQKIIGDFITSTKTMSSNVVNSFKGRAMEKEFQFADQMKVSDNDTWNTMLGKLSSLATYNKMTQERARIASQYIRQGKNRGEALELADKQVNGNEIRKQIDAQLNPKPTDEDINYMAQKYKISPDEVKKRLKDKGIS